MQVSMRATLLALAFCCTAIAQESVPPELRNWQGWVLKGEEFRRCPFLAQGQPANAPIAETSFRCTWPERLALSVDARGGDFTQRWQVYADSWVTLPGSLEYWPRDVRVNGAPAALVAHDGLPALRLVAGSYTIA